MSLTDEGHYGPKQLNLLKVVWGEGFLSPGGTEEIDEIVKNTNLEGKSILDIGCGPGWMLSALKDNWEKHGIEVSKFASNYAKKYCKLHNGTLDTFSGENFDVIIFYHVVEHLSDPISAIKKINKLLKKGGKLIIGTPDFDSGAARRYGSNFRLLHDKTHISLFSCDSMHRYLRDHGFKILDVSFPFFETPWFNKKDILRLFDKKNISPPFYGSSMTFLAEKK